jgi:hypothetical protein
MALWAVACRTVDLTLVDLQAAFDRGDFLRTHVLRPTWHFVAADDLPWLLALTAPRIARLMASANSAIGLDAARLDRTAEVIVQALADGRPRTRTELGDALAAAGHELRGQALAHSVMHAEINRLVANGPLRGKQHTYVALAPPAVDPPRDELLARVARRYGQGHGPFRDKDLAWWTSLTLTDSRRAIELGGLRPLDVDGVTHWTVEDPVRADVPRALLLANFDEYVSYARDPDDYGSFDGSAEDVLRGTGLLMVDGRLAGTWSRTLTATTVDITLDRHRPLTREVLAAVEVEVARFGRFVGREPRLRTAD